MISSPPPHRRRRVSPAFVSATQGNYFSHPLFLFVFGLGFLARVRAWHFGLPRAGKQSGSGSGGAAGHPQTYIPPIYTHTSPTKLHAQFRPRTRLLTTAAALSMVLPAPPGCSPNFPRSGCGIRGTPTPPFRTRGLSEAPARRRL